jgi:hypothetical protein
VACSLLTAPALPPPALQEALDKVREQVAAEEGDAGEGKKVRR